MHAGSAGHDASAPRRSAAGPVAIAFTLIGLALSIWMALRSDGVHHDDDLVHFQYAAWSSEYPQYLLHEWGRPGFTVLYALPAQLGWTSARVFTGLLTAATAWLAFRVAQQLGVRLAACVPILLWLQPMTFTLSYTTLTEPVLAFYLTFAMYLFQRGRFARSAAAISLCVVTRHEAAVFLLIWIVALVLRRRPAREWLLVFWAPVVHNVLSQIFLWQAPLALFLAPKPTDFYGAGGWLAMLARWMLAAGAGPLVLALIGGVFLWWRPAGRLWIGAGLAYFLAHTIIYRFGLFASGGYFRFLVPLGPVVAVAAAEALSRGYDGWKQLQAAEQPGGAFWSRWRSDGARGAAVPLWFGLSGAAVALLWLAAELETPDWLSWLRTWVRYGSMTLLTVCGISALLTATRVRALRLVGAAAVPLVLVGVALWQPLLARGVGPPFQQCAPLVLLEDQALIREAADWIRAQGFAERDIIAANNWVYHFLDRSYSPFCLPVPAGIDALPPGGLFVWDARYCPTTCALPRDGAERRSDLRPIWQSRAHSRDGVYCLVFEKRALPTE